MSPKPPCSNLLAVLSNPAPAGLVPGIVRFKRIDGLGFRVTKKTKTEE